MRVIGVFMILLLLGTALVLFLASRDAKSSMEAVALVADELREEGVVGAEIDHLAAARIIGVLERLVAEPESAAKHLEDLRVITETAAAWADRAPTASADLHMAVSIRAAALDLRSYAHQPSERDLAAAKRRLSQARQALAGQPPAEGSVGGLQDRLENLQQAHREQIQSLEEGMAE